MPETTEFSPLEVLAMLYVDAPAAGKIKVAPVGEAVVVGNMLFSIDGADRLGDQIKEAVRQCRALRDSIPSTTTPSPNPTPDEPVKLGDDRPLLSRPSLLPSRLRTPV